jgi:hypothetical protein
MPLPRSRFTRLSALPPKGYAAVDDALSHPPATMAGMRIEQSRRLPDGRVLTWDRVRQVQACATALDYNTDGKVDGVPISDDELGQLILGR